MMRAIVATASIGCAPTLVSPESISASAPSSTAFATSLASARVGRDIAIIDSSIWVATMTGFAELARQRDRALLHQRDLLERQLHAEVAARDHDPVERLDDLLEVLDRLRLLDLRETGRRMPTSSMIAWTGSMSSAVRTNDSAIRSTPSRSAQRRSSMSFSVSAGTLTATPGRLMPLLSESMPPSITRRGDADVASTVDGLERDPAVVDEDAVAGVHVAGQAR